MRLFLAINPEPEVRAAVYEATAPLRAAAPMLAWVREPRLHLTLKFLGEQPEAAVPPLAAAMDAVVLRHGAIQSSLGELGAFPNLRRPRVVWIGMDPDPRLELLHHDLEVAADALGYATEGKAFRPHVTLARVKHRLPAETLRELTRAARRLSPRRFPTNVRSIDLMRSVLRSEGAAYELVHSSSLRER